MSPWSLHNVVRVWIPGGIAVLIGLAVAFGPDREVAPSVPVAAPVPVRHVDGDPVAAQRRSQPSAVVANELVVPWSTLRTVVASGADDAASERLAEELSDVVETLRRTRRVGDLEIPLSATLRDLKRLEARVSGDPRWSGDPRVASALRRHHAVLARYPQVR